MAKLTFVYRAEDMNYVNIGRRQLPVVAGENLMMLMDLNSKGLSIDTPQIRGKDLEEFTRKFNLLNGDELRDSLEIDSATFVSVLNQCVQCVGCRRRVERLFYQLTLSGHPTLDPLVLKNSSTLSIVEEKLKTPQALGTILYRHHEVLNNVLESKLRNKTRCMLHSLDAFRSKPFSETWREVWLSMKHNCRDELAVIETKELHEVLENYLKKHKFCQGCRTKIEKAYKILVGEINTKEKGFVAALYANIKKCHPDKHIHVYTKKMDFLDALIRRAEPEVNGSYTKQRERHAKTLEIAQEEVLTCVGMIMYERLRRIFVSLREEERACQVLAAVGVHALCRSFDISVEKKQGISNLELLYQEISRAEKAKEHKRELKKLKRKKKKSEKKNTYRLCEDDNASSDAQDLDGEHDETFGDIENEALDIEEGEEEVEEEEELVEEDESGSNAEETDLLADVVPTDKRSTIGFVGVGVRVSEAEADGDDDDEEWEVVEGHHANQQKKKKLQKQRQNRRNQKQKQPQKLNKKPKQQSAVATEMTQSDASDLGRSCRPMTLTTTTTSTTTTAMASKCNGCLASAHECPCENDVKDSGYGSEPNCSSHGNSRTSSVVSSPDGSEVCCSEGFCNHERGNHEHEVEDEHHENDRCDLLYCQRQESLNPLSLQQMLNDFEGEDQDEENCYIPQEVVLEYQCQREKVQQQRQKLRETLRANFDRLCRQRGVSTPTPTIANRHAIATPTYNCK